MQEEEKEENVSYIFSVKAQNCSRQTVSINALKFDHEEGEWKENSSDEELLPVKMKVDLESFKKLAPKYKKLTPGQGTKIHREESTADTGAGLTCTGTHILKTLGITKENLIPTNVKIRVANNQRITCIHLTLKFSIDTNHTSKV